MTLTAQFNDDTWRVELSLSGWPNGAVRVERSTNGVFWQTVRGGLRLPVVGGSATLSDWEYQEGVQNTYRAVPVDPPAGLLLDGASGSYASTPDTAPLDITGDQVWTVDAILDDWTSAGGTQTLLAKWDEPSDQRSVLLQVRAGGLLRVAWSTDGTSATVGRATTTVPLPVESGRLAVRGYLIPDLDGSNHRVAFYTAPSRAGPWTPLELVTDTGTFAVHSGSAPLEVGSINGGTANNVTGTIVYASVWDGNIISGNLGSGTFAAQVDFDAQTGGVTQFVDDTGLTWTVHGDATIVGTESATITPSHGGKVILKSVRFPFLNRPITVTDFTDPELGDRGGMFEVSGRSVPVSTPDQRASSTFTVELMTDTREQARDMQLILRANPHLFLHVPAGCPVPGGHVRVGSVTPRRPTRSAGTDRRYWPLPCRLVAPPGPQVVGGTMTYAGLLNLYGGYDNLLAANPAYADLLALMGSPEDLVVL